ncbi:MAG: hypothetical protein FJ242_07495 [Nitrospira sp.]|nr:hypothetical protein [Nitrospira sp.]
MNLADELDNLHRHFLDEVLMIKDFLTGTYKAIVRKHSTKQKPFSEKDKQDLQNIIDHLRNDLEGRGKDEYISASKKVINYVIRCLTGSKHSEFLAEMTLVYLISFFEAFVKDYLRAILTSRSEILSSKKILIFEEVATFQSMRELVRYMAEKEVAGLAYDSVDDVANYFNAKFNINFVRDFLLWPIIREASYRRNIVVHNLGITDKTYCLKTGHKKMGEHLDTSIEYVVKVCDAAIDCIHFTHKRAKKKFVNARPTVPNTAQTAKAQT